ncbi:F-box domain, cyclin-like protein [Artemisia annua]|uniref:F-box domain, cyclin-like protein n=1 Tax=Artemisia annua TaxID=35608 RepID=A0A2U1Q1E3_ARTAN|nr:F-box domain, cyclin-like protein [Artemisia annua]
MILRSGKKLGHKDSSGMNVDMISNLPDSLLIDILYLLPPSNVKYTRLISKRWKNLIAFLPNICFLMKSCPSVEQVKKFHVFVDQTLAIHGDMPIKKLLLKCENKCDYDCFYDMLCTLVRFKAGIRELELRFPVISEDRNKVVKFCWDLFKTWDSLVGLTLCGGFMLDVSNDDELLFPCLKKISLIGINYESEKSVMNLISGCPVLEELLEVFNISSLSLKRLR